MNAEPGNENIKANECAPSLFKQSTTVQVKVEDAIYSHKVRQMLTTFSFIMVTSIPALLVGCTLGFPSAAILDLQDTKKQPEYRLDDLLSDVFGVSSTQ